MKLLYLDDVRPCPHGWDLVRNYDEFVAYIEKHGVPDVISFDHDLADEHYPWNASDPYPNNDTFQEKTGVDCVKWLTENGLRLRNVSIHTRNQVGRVRIESAVEDNLRLTEV